jgi:intein/homing endonuclease
MVRVTLNNGKHVDCTPDHRFIARDGSEVHAEDMRPGDPLMPLHRDESAPHECLVVSVERLEVREDTADITVESISGSHVFALDIGVYVHNSEGRGSKVETLPGGDATGEITDLTFFAKKLARGLRIPPAYLSLGSDDGNIAFNDGKLGQALIQEFRFSKYCMRLQALMAPIFDREFKRFLREGGIEIESSLFELAFNPPQNFTKYRQIELDSQQVQIYTQVQDNRRLSERFKLKRFLNLSEEELIENETLWKEENASKMKRATGSTAAETDVTTDLSSVGIRTPSDMGMDMGPPPDEMAPSDMGAPPPDGGTPPSPDAAGGVQINKPPT